MFQLHQKARSCSDGCAGTHKRERLKLANSMEQPQRSRPDRPVGSPCPYPSPDSGRGSYRVCSSELCGRSITQRWWRRVTVSLSQMRSVQSGRYLLLSRAWFKKPNPNNSKTREAFVMPMHPSCGTLQHLPPVSIRGFCVRIKKIINLPRVALGCCMLSPCVTAACHSYGQNPVQISPVCLAAYNFENNLPRILFVTNSSNLL